MKTESNEFYIGWQDEAPDGIAKRVRQFVWAVLVVVTAVSTLLVLNQSGFATSIFEFGQPSELEGILVKTPAPFLRVFRGNDVAGQPVFQNILLVAPGKHGLGEMLSSAEKQVGYPLENQKVKLNGTLIYHDGKTLMEVEKIHETQQTDAVPSEPPVLLGNGAFQGEITDPKCLFGVMKPGYGKPHRSCAARCIAGGIPPVLKSVSTDGQTQYFLLAGENGEPVNDEILPYVGDQVQVCGEIYRMGNWLVLYKNKSKPVTRLVGNEAERMPVCR